MPPRHPDPPGPRERHRRTAPLARDEGRGEAVPVRRRRERPRSGWWPVVLCLLFFAAGAPSPLYGIYRAQLRFSATTLTAVFATYALVLLLTLLIFGSLSDYLGRRA